ncbi:hypothetical protein A6F56_01140 [Prescottella equi]|uniref:hypothetical protein n=1 Tax=Rhodococcus hoagii TaxID=43767 RepID=UPI000A0FC2DE|nr:hypothetical protein [Prescottella equi]ORL00984.1 hypothetical protein A6F56_01140 [Prescottella equi]
MSTAEQIIAEHRVSYTFDGEGSCTCGEKVSQPDHAAHVVAALTNAGKAIVEQSAAVETLLDTRAGLLLAHNAWHEGLSAGISACNAEGPWRKPESPYFAPWAAARVAEGGDQP